MFSGAFPTVQILSELIFSVDGVQSVHFGDSNRSADHLLGATCEFDLFL